MPVIYHKNVMYGGGSGGGGGGSTVVVTPILESGVPIATISVDGTDTTLYAPQGGGTEGIVERNYSTLGQSDIVENNVKEKVSAEVV